VKTHKCSTELVGSAVRVAGGELEGFNPVLSLLYSHGQCRQLSLEGVRFVVLTSAVSYHLLPGKHTQAHRRCWTTQQVGARDAKYQLTFACCGLLGLVSSHALLFFCSLLLGNGLLHFFGPVGKILGCKAESHNPVRRPASPGQLPGTGSFRCGDFRLRVFCCLFKC